jgi:hypothetical protein
MPKNDTPKILGQDPFEDMEWDADLDGFVFGEPDSDSLDPEAGPVPPAAVGSLRGKGVWLLFSGDIDLAIEMALAIGARHIIYKTGHRGMFFVDTAQRIHDRVRAAGMTPFAWYSTYCDDPSAESEVAIKSMQAGYEGVIFDIEEQASGRALFASAMGHQLMEAGLHPENLYYTSYPNIWQHTDIPYRELNAFCRGGFMPKCYPSFQRTPRTVIRKWAYGEHARWSKEWENMPPLYPILATYKDEQGTEKLGVQEFLDWAEELASFAPSFYSVFHASATGRELWSILAALGEGVVTPRPEPVEPETRPTFREAAPVRSEPASALSDVAPARPEPIRPEPRPTFSEPAPPRVERTPPPPIHTEPAPSFATTEEPPAPLPELKDVEERKPGPQPAFYEVTINDTVRRICERNSISRTQFWEWNGHLWDERGLPRDALYMQEGWRVRVG